MNAGSRGMRCRYCDEAFKRKEHLDRHLRRHVGSKPFQCTVCLKAFSRKDVLNRHLTTHELNSASPSSPRRPGKKPQACLSCSRAKQRCSKGNPCRSCASKGRICRYPSDGVASDGVTTPAGQSHGSETPAVDAGDRRTLPSTSSRATAPMPTDAEYGRLVHAAEGLVTLNEPGSSLNADVIPMPSYTVRAAAHPGQPMDIASEFETFSASMNPTGAEGTQAWNSAFVSFNQPFPWSFSQDLLGHEFPGPIPSSVTNNNRELVQEGESVIASYVDPTLGFGSAPGVKPCACEDCPSFPSLEPGDEDVLLAEDFCHVSKINGHDKLAQFFQEQNPPAGQEFPVARVIVTFVQLYYEHFDLQFPCIHPTMLENGDEAWVSLLAVATIGSQYSCISNSQQYSIGLQELLSRAVAAYKPEPHRTPSLHIVQSTLLNLVCLQFSGSQRGSMRAQWQRSQLISLCRFVVSFQRSGTTEMDPAPEHEQDWSGWLAAESRVRLVHCLYKLECLQLSFLSLPPIYKLHELTNRFPAHENVWRCRDAERWRIESRCPEVRAAGRIGLDLSNKHDVVAKMGSFARQMHMLSLYTEEKFLHYQLSSPLWKTLMAGMSNPVDTQPNINTLLTNAATSVDDAFETLRGIDSSSTVSPEGEALLTYYHVLSILRQVPLRKLYEFSGWQVTEPQIEAARDHLQKWMRNKPTHARKCFWHAAVVFKVLRNKRHFACDSPFCMLVVVLYMWAFDQFAQLKEDVLPGDAANCGGTDRPTRVDLLQDENETELWLEKGSSSIHITGVGVLKSTKSGARMISECRRILLSANGWSQLCRFLAGAWERVSGGGRPHGWSEA